MILLVLLPLLPYNKSATNLYMRGGDNIANVDFKFDFEKALENAYHDDEIYQDISCIAKGLDMKITTTEDALRKLIKINSSVLAKVLKQYNHELLNEI